MVFVGCRSGQNCLAGHFVSCPNKHVQLHHHADPGLQHGDGPGGLAPRLHAPRLPLAGGVRRHPQADCHLQTVSPARCWGGLRAEFDPPPAGRKTPDRGATIQSVITSTPPHPRASVTTPTTTPPSATVTT